MLIEMKKLSLIVIGGVVLSCAAQCQAAQDQTLVQETRKNQLSHEGEQTRSTPAPSLPKPALDHGPRAQVTPWVNRQRRAAQETTQQGTEQHKSTAQ